MASYFEEIGAAQLSPTVSMDTDWGGADGALSDDADLNMASFLQEMGRLSLAATPLTDQQLEPLVAHLQDTEPRLLEAPPASRLAVAQLPMVAVKDVGHVCGVCKSELAAAGGSGCAGGGGADCATSPQEPRVARLPCRHSYHPGCILPWLAKYNCCPSCRFEMPTDDAAYEASRAAERLLQSHGPPPPASATTGDTEVSGMYD